MGNFDHPIQEPQVSREPEGIQVPPTPIPPSQPEEPQAAQASQAVQAPQAPHVDSASQASETIAPAFPEVEGLVGVGVDIVDIDHMRQILQRTPSFTRKVFSADEQAYCESMTDPVSHYALRFAAKEAVLKALGTGFFEDGIGIRDIEVRRNDKGTPFVHLMGAAKARAEALGVREIPLSLSYTHQEAVAFAMSITNESIRVKEQRRDPKADLAQKFKQARGMLDEL